MQPDAPRPPPRPTGYEALLRRVQTQIRIGWVQYDACDAKPANINKSCMRRRVSGSNLAIWSNSQSGGNLADSNLTVRVQSGSISNLSVRWAIPNLANVPIWRYSQSGNIPKLACCPTKIKNLSKCSKANTNIKTRIRTF